MSLQFKSLSTIIPFHLSPCWNPAPLIPHVPVWLWKHSAGWMSLYFASFSCFQCGTKFCANSMRGTGTHPAKWHFPWLFRLGGKSMYSNKQRIKMPSWKYPIFHPYSLVRKKTMIMGTNYFCSSTFLFLTWRCISWLCPVQRELCHPPCPSLSSTAIATLLLLRS